MVQDANIDYSYIEYSNNNYNDNEYELNGLTFECNSKNKVINDIDKYAYKGSDTNYITVELKDEKYDSDDILSFYAYFEQRPDAKMVFYNATKMLNECKCNYNKILMDIDIIESVVKKYNGQSLLDVYNELKEQKDTLKENINKMEDRIDRIATDAKTYIQLYKNLKIIKQNLSLYEDEFEKFEDYDIEISPSKTKSTGDIQN